MRPRLLIVICVLLCIAVGGCVIFDAQSKSTLDQFAGAVAILTQRCVGDPNANPPIPPDPNACRIGCVDSNNYFVPLSNGQPIPAPI